jgi:N-acetyl sugar amidotransferase
MDNSNVETRFDANGISHHFYDFHNNVKSHWNPDDCGREYLERLAGRIKKEGENKEFDCILGLSGGLDSSYMLHTMVKNYGVRPLVFHVDGGWNSEESVHNIQVLVDKLGIDLYTEVINWEEMRDFQLAWFKSGVPHIDIPQDHAFIAVLYKFAEKYHIKYILNGGNISTECIKMPYHLYYWGTDMRHINHIIKQFCTISMKSYPFSSVFRHKLYLPYIKGIKVVKPLNYVPYNKILAAKILAQEYGWKNYPQKHFESRFTKFLEGYWLPSRFGFDVRRNQLSSLILTGQISREEALLKLKTPPYDQDTIKHDFEYIATKLGISKNELRGYHEMPKKYYSDYPNNHIILSMIEKIMTMFSIGRRGGSF